MKYLLPIINGSVWGVIAGVLGFSVMQHWQAFIVAGGIAFTLGMIYEWNDK